MKSLLKITLVLVLFSCGRNSEKNDLLTSSAWTSESGTPDGTSTQKFLHDGTYFLEVGGNKVHGKWNWTKDGEIYLQAESITINGKENHFNSGLNTYIKIVELTDKTLRTVERGEGDTWDSGFTKEHSYTAQSL